MPRNNQKSSTSLLIFFLLCFSATSSAAKIYKWKDENGQVHFGEQPPSHLADKPDPTTEEVSIRNDQGTPINAVLRGDRWYCGESSFFTQRDPISDLASIKSNLPDWEQQRADAQRNLEKARQEVRNIKVQNTKHNNQYTSGYESRLNWPTKNYNNIRCKISWAKQQLNKLQSSGQNFIDDYNKNLEHLKFLKTERNANCDRPENGWMTGDQYEEYKKCAESYDQSIERLEKKLSKQKYKIKQIQKN